MPCGCFKLFEMSSQTFLFYVLETRGVFKLPRPNFQKEGEKRGVRPEKKGIEHKCSVRYVFCGREVKISVFFAFLLTPSL